MQFQEVDRNIRKNPKANYMETLKRITLVFAVN